MILIALGSNLPGPWGRPRDTLERALEEMSIFPGTSLLSHSRLYRTAGIGPGQPDDFVNAVATIECHSGPESLLRRLKMTERAAGPRSAQRWGPRTLDLDILDYRHIVRGWACGRALRYGANRGELVLPHPLLHLRPFILMPLVELLPDWRHPVLQRSASQLWSRIRTQSAGRVIAPL